MKRNGCSNGEAGFTLLEVLVSMAIMALVVVGIYGAISTASRTYYLNANMTYLENAAGMVQENVMEELAYATPLATDTGGLGVTFWTPVDADGMNGSLDKLGEIEWGYDGDLGYSRRIRFIKEDLLDEHELKRDINRNNYPYDRFYVGRLVAETLDENGVRVGGRESIGPRVVLVSYPYPGGDVDGDGEDDPIFARYSSDGKTLSATGPIFRVKLVATAEDANKDFQLTTQSMSIRLRNTQTDDDGGAFARTPMELKFDTDALLKR
ncbi:MAG: prepilin-type N-terminal cleavage/methylation domain-containing protein [Planctomycetes bacterium]|nr:prepilin-type N-terminal cleavage/methylation domain-containing protein [Planctomycetota bacterium]